MGILHRAGIQTCFLLLAQGCRCPSPRVDLSHDGRQITDGSEASSSLAPTRGVKPEEAYRPLTTIAEGASSATPESANWKAREGCFSVPSTSWDRSPNVYEWCFSASRPPTRLLDVAGTHFLRGPATTYDESYRWTWRERDRAGARCPPECKHTVVEVVSVKDNAPAATFELFPPTGPLGQDYLGYPLGYTIRPSPGGRFLFMDGAFQYDGVERTFAVLDLGKRRRRGDLAQLGILAFSASDFASTDAWSTLVLDPAETRIATEQCTHGPAGQGYASEHDIGRRRLCTGRVLIVDASSGRELRALDTGLPGAEVAWAPNGDYVATGAHLTVWDVHTGAVVVQFRERVHAIAWVDDATIAGLDLESSDLDLFSVAKRERTGRFPSRLRPQGLATLAAPAMIGIVGRWGAAAALRFVRPTDGEALTLRAAFDPNEQARERPTAIWFTDAGVYDDDSKTQMALAGALAPGVSAAWRAKDLWARFWSGERQSEQDAAAPAQDHEDARAGSCGQTDGGLCRVEALRCPSGYLLRGTMCEPN